MLSRVRLLSPPGFSVLIVLLLALSGILCYQQGYFLLVSSSLALPSFSSRQHSTLETPSLRGYAGSWYQVYFTKPHYPEGPSNRADGLDETLAADLDRAHDRIEVLSFDLDLQRVADALLRAQQRGVAVRVSIDSENLETPAVAKLTGEFENRGIPIFYDRRSAFMHDKIIVIDDTIVWTGSWNLTINDTFRNNNNMLRIVDQRLAANYTAKADAIFAAMGGPGQPSILRYPEVTLGGITVINAFSPEDPVTRLIVEQINAARQRIDVLAFVLTSDPIIEALIAASERGLAVRGVLERRNVRGGGAEPEHLRQAGLDIHVDGNCYIMHHKVIIIDGAIVITGSFNFTQAAQAQNDENVLIIHDEGLAARYSEEFERVYAQALQPTRCE